MKLTKLFLLLWASSSGICAVKVVVTPASAIVKAGGTAVFSVTVTGATDSSVIWTIDQNRGAIDPDTGVYTAPGDIAICENTVIVTASSREDSTATAIAEISLGDSKDKHDCREDFGASFYLGIAVDTFAADEHRKYLNPDAASGKAERGVGGFGFEYRLAGMPNRAKNARKSAFSAPQLWVSGETVHGTRSADVPCDKNPDFFLCKQGRFNYKTINGTDPTADLLLIIRNASSLEGYMGLRFEFLTLNALGNNPANVYFKAQAGFLKVSGSTGGALDMHHVGVGAIATKGLFQGSYLEAGWGRSDTFTTKRRDRKKVDGFLVWKLIGPLSAYAQMTVDTDVGYASDSIQSYFGLQFDIRKFKF